MARRATKKSKKKRSRRVPRRTSKKKSSRKLPVPGFFRKIPWLKVFAAVTVVFLIYVTYLDFVVRGSFEDSRWQLPAKVYARPLELYQNLRLNADDFERELNLLNYRYAYQPKESGTFQRDGNGFDIVTRAFTFWDINELSQHIHVSFSGDHVSRIKNVRDGKEIALLRLDPVLVGGIYPLKKEDRKLITLKDAPELLPEILVAVEDRKFYKHFGIDPMAIARAFIANIRAGKSVQGGSTITQQLVKNFFLTNERSLWRKFNEIIMAVLLDFHYEKDEIMQAYINEIYLGQDRSHAVHGFGLASQFYFAKPIHQLNLNQLTTLVALIRGPSYYHPENHPKRLLSRRNRILEILLEQKVISPELYAATKSLNINIIKKRHVAVGQHPAFLDLVKRQLREYYPEEKLQSEGLKIFTTMNPVLQLDAEQSTRKRLASLDRQKKLNNKLQAAAVVVNSTSAEVLALVGDRNPRFSGFNRALDASRPIGSLIKPVVYLSALQQHEKHSWSSIVLDKSISIKTKDENIWTPRNYDNTSHGEVTLITAMTKSYNQATVRLGLEIGFPKINQVYKKLGGPEDLPPYPSILLGAQNLSPIEVTQLYQTLAANGFRSPIRAIREVLDVDGQPLRRYPIKVQQSINSDDINLITSGLVQVTKTGTASALSKRLPNIHVAGKTGTTNDTRDSWFAGFSGSHVGVVWLGTDDNQPTQLTGSTGALQLWADIFRHANTESLKIEKSDNIESQWIDSKTGLLSKSSCSGSMQLTFVKGTAPTESANDCPRSGVREQINNTVEWFKQIFR